MPQLTDEQLARLPAAQRAQLQAMMKGSAGGSPRTNTSKACLTRESLAKALSFSQQNNSCTQKVTSLASDKQEIHLECANPTKGAGDSVKTSGDLIIERVDSEHAKGNMVMKSSGERPMTMKMSFTTKFLSSDCGDVKPMGEK